ncbi:class I adenylate-forming enzyme family protein [Actinomadura sp. LOL_016]|uniref:class I adenylate-forming enzyme family protein n=1 Tax=unclassified Actinomadura TaxID=2626254 RepID=UPI003A8037D6
MTVRSAGTSQARRIAQLAKERPDWPAYRHVRADGTEEAVTCAWLDDRASRLAGAFAERGVGHGNRVGLGLRNSPQFVISVFATWKLGAVPVPVRWDVPDWELERLRAVIDPRLYLGPDDVGWIDASSDLAPPELPDVVSPHMQGICSSGSTGTPKIILSSTPAVHNPVISTPMAEAWMPVPRPQTVLVLAPMYHVNAFATLYSLVDGDRLVVMEKFDAALALDLIERHGVTTFTATPTMLQRMADVPGADDRDLSSLVWIQQGAAPMPPSLVHRWAELVGPERIVMAYGMTEALGITALRGDEWMRHQGSVGRGLRGTEVKVLDADGRELPLGELGEIFLRAPSYGGSTYLGHAPRLAETPDGFRAVGDMGYLDADGYLYLVDRRVDMITTGGANVFPAEVEAALIDHPKIADVVVIGLRDPEWGRRVHAIVQPADPAAPPAVREVVAYAKGRLAAYKVPKTVELVEAIPRSAATKVNRGRLVEARGG